MSDSELRRSRACGCPLEGNLAFSKHVIFVDVMCHICPPDSTTQSINKRKWEIVHRIYYDNPNIVQYGDEKWIADGDKWAGANGLFTVDEVAEDIAKQ